MHVFLSYSRRDAAFVGRLADDLATHGIEPWLDTDDLPIDDEDRWRRSVVQGIRESAAIILVLSPDSVRSAAVERELTIAAEMTRRIIPIMHRTCELSDGVMFELAGLQRTDFAGQPYDTALDELVHRILAGPATRTDDPPPPITRLGGSEERLEHVPVEVGAARNTEADRAADADAQTHGHAAATEVLTPTRSDPRGRRRSSIVGASVGLLVVVVALAGIGLLRGDGGDNGDARISTPTAIDGSTGTSDPDGGVPASSSPDTANGSTLVPWDVATATLQRRDGTTATVPATSVGLACRTGELLFTNGQTVSLALVRSIRFDSIDRSNDSADGVVTLLDGRELPGPFNTWNCPISGTTDLGPLTIELEDIQRIDLNRDPAVVSGAGSGATSVEVPAGSSPDTANGSRLVPWDEATATLQRRDGTTATVPATSVGLACRTGELLFTNGQTVSLELVRSIRFDSIDRNSDSADGVVTLLDGRDLPGPINTWNCPISGTTDLGPLTIELEDIQRIDLNR